MITAIRLTIGKEFRLLWRDPVGLFMLLIAPIVVIAAAGFSLAKIYGGETGRKAEYPIAVVDEDRDIIGRAITDALGHEPAVRVIVSSSRTQAIATVRESKKALIALIIPAGTTRAVFAGRDSHLIIYNDPVRYLETVRVELRLDALCRAINASAAAQVRTRVNREAARLKSQLEAADAAAATALQQRQLAERQAQRERVRFETELRRRIDAAAAETQAKTEQAIDAAIVQMAESARSEAEQQRTKLAELHDYLSRLNVAESQFVDWLARLRAAAGSHAADIPAPPELPAPPAELKRPEAFAAPSFDVTQARKELAAGLKVPRLSIELPLLPQVPAIAPIPRLSERALGEIAVPGILGVASRDLTGSKPTHDAGFNIFDLQVPGFAITFLLIGMLIGVSVAMIDEREWGTLDRLRSASTPLAATIVGKMIARFVVGLLQLSILFVAGHFIFAMSLGQSPTALILPCAAITFAGVAFGLVVAGIGVTRDAVLPIGAIVIMTMAAVGGCWWPIDFEPKWMQTAALALPTTWAMAAFNDLTIRWLPATTAVVPSLVDFGFGAIYAVVGTVLVYRRF